MQMRHERYINANEKLKGCWSVIKTTCNTQTDPLNLLIKGSIHMFAPVRDIVKDNNQ